MINTNTSEQNSLMNTTENEAYKETMFNLKYMLIHIVCLVSMFFFTMLSIHMKDTIPAVIFTILCMNHIYFFLMRYGRLKEKIREITSNNPETNLDKK